jgi:hypothetical protein
MIFKHNTSWHTGASNKSLEDFGIDLVNHLNIERQGAHVSQQYSQRGIGHNSLLGEE